MTKKNTGIKKRSFQKVLEQAVKLAREVDSGNLAAYIPELAEIPSDITAVSVLTTNGDYYCAGDMDDNRLITLQSTAKIALLVGLLEEFGEDEVFKWTKKEPSGADFASIARLDQFGPLPSNPMLNAGAISLCNHIPGETNEQHLAWLEQWMEKCFGHPLKINQKVFASERRTGDRNRSLAYLMKSTGVINGDVDNLLEIYFYLCSFECNVATASYFPMLLANAGLAPSGERILSRRTVALTLSIMTTCGLYNESGEHLVRTGLPAKSGVSGFILAVAPDIAGIAVFSPLVNVKGTSLRGEAMLESVAKAMEWHFAVK